MTAGNGAKELAQANREIIDRIFKDPATQYELTEFRMREICRYNRRGSRVEQLIEEAARG